MSSMIEDNIVLQGISNYRHYQQINSRYEESTLTNRHFVEGFVQLLSAKLGQWNLFTIWLNSKHNVNTMKM